MNLLLTKHWSIIAILIIAVVLRFWQLGSIPPSLDWDEAALGYNAYSLLETGRDEYGNILPLNLKSFGDYKPAVYAYLDVPFVALLGLNELAVRFPSALLGVLLVLVSYLLVKEIFENEYLAITVALSMAISPLAVFFSRPAFETSTALFLNTLATFFFIKATRKSSWFIFSAICFGLSLFTYQSSRLFVPILILGLIILYKDQIIFDIKTKISLAIVLIMISLVGSSLFVEGGSNRLSTVSFLSYQRSEDTLSQISQEEKTDVNSLSFQFLHGEWFAYIKGFVERYLIYFSPKMLFFDGDDNPRHDIPDFGLIYYSSMILIPIGMIFLLSYKGNRETKKGIRLIFLWLIIAPIPAILSKDLLNIIRAFNITLPITILEGAGIYCLVSKVQEWNKWFSRLIILLLGIALLLNVTIFIDRYFVHLSKELSEGWVYGLKQVLVNLDSQKLSKYDQVGITDDFGQPYIYYLFYTKYPPRKFQKQAILEQPTVDVGTVRKIDNIEFRFVNWRVDRLAKNALFIGTYEELPENDVKPFHQYRIVQEIQFLNGKSALRMVEVKQ